MNRQEFEQQYEHLQEEGYEDEAQELLEYYTEEEERQGNKLCIKCTILFITSMSVITAACALCQS